MYKCTHLVMFINESSYCARLNKKLNENYEIRLLKIQIRLVIKTTFILY